MSRLTATTAERPLLKEARPLLAERLDEIGLLELCELVWLSAPRVEDLEGAYYVLGIEVIVKRTAAMHGWRVSATAKQGDSPTAAAAFVLATIAGSGGGTHFDEPVLQHGTKIDDVMRWAVDELRIFAASGQVSLPWPVQLALAKQSGSGAIH